MAQRRLVVSLRHDGVVRHPAGFISVPAVVSRVGIFEYRTAGGEPYTEYRPAEEVSRADSVNSFKNVTVTVYHPQTGVDPKNWKSHAVGHVGDDVRYDAETGEVWATLHIHDAATIARIEKRELTDLSPGYSVDLKEECGMCSHGRYDAIQTNIIYNHLSLLPPGAGRQGSRVALRLDSVGDCQLLWTHDLQEACHTDARSAKEDSMTPEELKTLLAESLAEVRADAKAQFELLTESLSALNSRLDAEEEKKKDFAKEKEKEDEDEEEKKKDEQKKHDALRRDSAEAALLYKDVTGESPELSLSPAEWLRKAAVKSGYKKDEAEQADLAELRGFLKAAAKAPSAGTLARNDGNVDPLSDPMANI
jgi:hypothetical protein